MENAKSPEISEALKDKAIRLINYLTELEHMKLKVVRNIDDYQNVLWLSDISKDSEYCFTRAWGKNEEYDEDIWIEIKKYREPVLEGIPRICGQWIDRMALNNTRDIPELLPNIIIQEKVKNPDADPENPEIDEFITVNKTIYLRDYPEVSEAWEQFVVQKWFNWSELHQKWESVQKVYAKLFSIYQEQQKLGEQYELVLGLGFLSWRIPTGLIIRRHFITAKALLIFDAKIGKFTVKPAVEGSELTPELDMLDPENQPHNLKQTIIEGLASANDDPWEYSSVEPLLKTIVNSLADKGQGEYYNSLERRKTAREKPIVEYAPALMLRKRSIRGLVQTLKAIKEQIESGAELPAEFSRLCEINQAEDDNDEDEGNNLSGFKTPQTIYFPKPFNNEQYEIVHKLQSRKGVLVQGPPGTGKSHTIANLICHFLANGKRILVTAKTPRALKVLYHQMPKQIKPLCVSLLGSGLEEKTSLEESVGSILNKQDRWNKSLVTRSKERLEKEIIKLKSEKAQINKRIKSIRESETLEQNIFAGKYIGTSAKIARRLKKESEKYHWFRDKIRFDQEMPLYKEEIEILHEDINLLKPKIEDEYQKFIPNPKKDLLSQNEFEEIVKNCNKAEKDFNSVSNLLNSIDGKILTEKSNDAVEKIKFSLIELIEAITDINKLKISWTNQAAFDVLNGNDVFWKEFLSTFSERMHGLKERAKEMSGFEVKIPDGISLKILLEDALILKKHFEQDGKNRLWFLKNKEIRKCKYLTEETYIDSEPCNSCKKLKLLIEYIEIKEIVDFCWNLWSGRAENTSEPFYLQISRLEELKMLLSKIVSLSDLLESLRETLNCVKEIKNKLLCHNIVELTEIRNICQAIILKNNFNKAKSKLQKYIEKFKAFSSLLNTHSINNELLMIIQEKDIKSYPVLLKKLENINETSEKIKKSRGIFDKLSANVPFLANDLLQGIPEVIYEFKNLENAWYWARANSWLTDFLNKDDLPSLERSLEQTNKLISKNIADVSALLAWNYCFNRMNESHRRHLVGWQEAFKKASMKYTKYKNRYMKDAQRQLSKCKDAIPAWVMPLHRVYETVETRPGMFDLIIVDEASQCGPEALPLIYLGTQLLIVGDDKQISPVAVGISREQVFRLREEYIYDFDHADSFGIEDSLFTHGRIRFGAPIVLREHFRCMPEIIRFSNNLCYQATHLIPLRQYPPERLEPVETVYVSDGYREGKANRAINRPEAEKLVETIVSCCKDIRYTGKTMGVITLQGNAQAPLIEGMLLEELGAEEMSERKLICGNPYSFQGDERDIIFMSMVAAPNERIGALSKASDERRFNVAASRAKDQEWLFYSVTTSDLSQTDLRKKLIEFFEDPAKSELLPGFDLDTLQEKAYRANRQIEKAQPPFDSWFEVDVALKIAIKGFQVIPQYQVAGKRIDLVIEGTKTRLAVECYGDHWHGEDEYEHDIERQRMLERCGWNFYIIRECEYYANPEKSLEKLWGKLKQMGIHSITDIEIEDKINKPSDNNVKKNIDFTEKNHHLPKSRVKTIPINKKNSIRNPDHKKEQKEVTFKKIPKNEKIPEKTIKISDAKIKYYKNIFQLYKKFGTFEKVAGKVSLTSKRVQQILEIGNKYELFEYPIKKVQLILLDKIKEKNKEDLEKKN